MRQLVLLAVLVCVNSAAALADDPITHLSSCAFSQDKEKCEFDKTLFKREFPKAYQGDYQAQRNIAYCLRDGCGGAIRRNPSLACAWRMVIIASGSPRVEENDRSNLRFACGELDALGLEAAKLQAARLGRVIEAR